MKFKGYSYTAIGSREMNQDSILADNEKGIFAVADGVGGGVRGDVASQMAVAALQADPERELRLRQIVEAAQESILREALETVGEPLMGTTLTAIRFIGVRVEMVHVGDSRCYLFSEGSLRCLTQDHETYDEELKGTVLSSYLGIPSDVHPLRIQEEVISVRSGNRLILCSDGLYKQLPEDRIIQLISQYDTFPETLLEKLGEEAAKADFSDNISIVYVQIED